MPIPGPWGSRSSSRTRIATRVLVPDPGLAAADVLHLPPAARSRARAGPGWPSARTRRPPRRWASTRSRPSCWPSRSARGSPASPGAFTGAYHTAIFARDVQLRRLDPRRDHDHPGRHRHHLRGVIFRRVRRCIYVDRAAAVSRRQLDQRPDRSRRRSTLQSAPVATSADRRYNYLLFGMVLVIMMFRRPEGLFPDAGAKAEMHGVGVAAEVTGATGDELTSSRSSRRSASTRLPIADRTRPPEPVETSGQGAAR